MRAIGIVPGMVLAAALTVWASPAPAAEAQGSVEWLRRVELSTPVSGVVEKVHVAPGDRVEAGQPLVSLDQRALRAELARARAELKRRERLRAEAKRELARAQELFDRTLLSEHELELARIADGDAEADLRSAQAALTHAELELEYSVIRAPFSAIVLARAAEVGQTVVTRLQPMPLVTVAESRRALARITLDEEALRAIAAGQQVSVRFNGRSRPGRVQHLGLEPVDGEQGRARYPIDVLFDLEERDSVRAGQAVTVVLP